MFHQSSPPFMTMRPLCFIERARQASSLLMILLASRVGSFTLNLPHRKGSRLAPLHCYRDSDGRVFASFPTDDEYIGRNRRAFLGTAAAIAAASILATPSEPAKADESLVPVPVDTADEAAKALLLKQRLTERRALMQASRTSSSRQSYLDLSRQRATLYNTTSRAANCAALPNLPCL